jgi:hypothetical protein
MQRIAGTSLVLLMLAACGGSENPEGGTPLAAADTAAPEADAPGPARAASLDACALFTADEVRSILGAEAKGTRPDVTGFDLACDWSAGEAGEPPQELSIEVGRLSALSVKREYDGFKDSMAFREEVEGIGDEAFFADPAGPGAILVTRSDTLLVFVSTSVPTQENRLKDLGQVLLERLEPMRTGR